MSWILKTLLEEERKTELKTLHKRIEELELAIRVHREKVQLIQEEDMNLWAHLNDVEQ